MTGSRHAVGVATGFFYDQGPLGGPAEARMSELVGEALARRRAFREAAEGNFGAAAQDAGWPAEWPAKSLLEEAIAARWPGLARAGFGLRFRWPHELEVVILDFDLPLPGIPLSEPEVVEFVTSQILSGGELAEGALIMGPGS